MDHNQQGQQQNESEHLVTYPAEGCHENLDEVVRRYRPHLYRLALRILRSPEEAEDAVQNGLLNAVRNFNKFEGRSKTSTWLTRIVINAALMVRRSKHIYREAALDNCTSDDERQATTDIPDRRPNPEQVCYSSELRALLHEHVKHLSPALRSVFQLCYIEGLSVAEAGQSLGVSLPALKSRTGRVRRQLIKSLNQTFVRPLSLTSAETSELSAAMGNADAEAQTPTPFITI